MQLVCNHLADEESSAPSSPVFPTELRDKPVEATVKPKGYQGNIATVD